MAYCETIHGKYVDLKCVTPDDAKFTLEIRQDPEFSKYLPRINNTLEQQMTWIKQQQLKEDDYFFVVWSKEGERIGTVGVFDIGNNPAKVGRLAMKGNAFQNIEAHLMILQFGFYTLQLEKLWGFVFHDNERAIRFDLQYGAVFQEPIENDEGRLIREVTFCKDDLESCMPKLTSMLYRKISDDMTYLNLVRS